MSGGLLVSPAGSRWLDAALRVPLGQPQRMLRIGHILPAVTGPRDRSLALGIRFGVEEAQHAGRLFGAAVELVADANVDRMLGGPSRPHVLVGGPSEASCARLTEVAAAEGLLFFNVGCASDALRGAQCRRSTFHIAASDAMRRDAFAEAGLSASEGEVLLWHASLERYGAGQLNARFVARLSTPMDSDAWAGWVAVKIAAETCFRAKSCSAPELLDGLERATARFDGHKGRPLSFRLRDHQLRQPLYVVRPGEPSSEIIEVPLRGSAGTSAAAQLDRLGTPGSGSACTWDT